MPLGECHGFPDCRRLIRVGGAPVPIGLAPMPLDVADTALGQPLVQSRGAVVGEGGPAAGCQCALGRFGRADPGRVQ